MTNNETAPQARARALLKDIGRRRAASPTPDEITAACQAARAAGIPVTEMAELTGIRRQWLYERHLNGANEE